MTNAELLAKIKAEIERLYDGEAPKHDQQCDFDDGYFTGISKVFDVIDSLQREQPEVDLEKEVHNYLKTHHLHIKDGGRVVFENDDSPNFMCDIRDIALHFYELGVNARKV